MKKKFLILITGVLIIGLMYTGIKMFNFAKGVQEDVIKVEKINEKFEIKHDTINADNYNLLFFLPNEAEFETLTKKYGTDSGLVEVDADFRYYANEVFDSLSKTNLKVRFVTERIIKYSTKNGSVYLDRMNNNKNEYGIIFNQPDCNPKIDFGIMTDAGIYQELADYIKNCK